MSETDEPFEAMWRAQHLDRVEVAVALGETVTARTVATPSASSEGVASFTAPPLPSISLGAGGDGAPAGEGLAPSDPHDLVVLAKLGEGGMGKVLLARQRSLAREVAVKVLRPDRAELDDARALLREAVVMGGLEHPSIVPVHALGRDEKNHPVLVMKRIDGTSWRELVYEPEHPRWRPLLEAHGDRLTAHLEVLMRVADAVHFAHARGVVHRDVKPDNVMVGSFGEVYLVDWGIAVRVGRDAAPAGAMGAGIRGTPMFMAPEMIEGDPARIDARTDVYLLGATLHEVLTRTPRHAGANLHAVLYSAHVSKPVRYGPEVPEELAALCNDATHVDPARRPQSAQEFRRRVTEFLGHRASLTLAATAQERLAQLEEGIAAASLDDASARRLATEGRFGFAQSLAVWPANPRAKEGLARTLRCLFAYELTRENLDAARALAHELRDDSDATRARLDALALALVGRKEREAHSLREAHESDLSLNARERMPLFALLTAASMVINFFLRAPIAGSSEVSLARMTRINLGLLVLFVALLAVAHKRVLVNRATRQVAALGLVCFGGTYAHRALLLATSPRTPLADVLLVDELFLAGVSIVAALGIRPWLGWLAAWSLAGVALTALYPAWSLLWFTSATTGIMLTCLYFGWVRERPSAAVAARSAP